MKTGDVILNRYRLTRLLDEGETGTVFEARDRETDRTVAIKVFFGVPEDLGGFVVRSLRDARTASEIESEHFVTIHDTGETEEGVPYVVMEHLEGDDLASILAREGSLEPHRAASLVLQASEALRASQEQFVIHGDLKTSDLFITRKLDGTERIKLLGFGMAKIRRALRRKRPGRLEAPSMTRSDLYTAPEHLGETSEPEESVDIYALGVILYELLTGKLPFEADSLEELTEKVNHEDPEPIRQLRPEVDEELAQVAHRAMARDRWDRYLSLRALSDELRPVVEEHVEDPLEPATEVDDVVEDVGGEEVDRVVKEAIETVKLPRRDTEEKTAAAGGVVLSEIDKEEPSEEPREVAEVGAGRAEEKKEEKKKAMAGPSSAAAPPAGGGKLGTWIVGFLFGVAVAAIGVLIYYYAVGTPPEAPQEPAQREEDGGTAGEQVTADVIILYDSRCKRRECETAPTAQAIQKLIPSAKIVKIEHRSPRGRELFDASEAKLLPVLMFSEDIEADESALQRIKRQTKHVGRFYIQGLGRVDPATGEWRERPAVRVRYLADARCKTRECQSLARFDLVIKRLVPNARTSTIDYNTAEGQALWQKLLAASASAAGEGEEGTLGLPLALFDRSITREPEAFKRLSRRLRKVGDAYLFRLGSWDPTAELCDNEVDDDGDELVDCDDEDCRGTMSCRDEEPRSLRVFVMSGCPYGMKVLDAMHRVLERVDNNRRKMDFRVEFIGTVTDDGELASMHGDWEVEEDLREICAQEHYPENYAFMDYIVCRNRDIRSSDWEECATGPIKADVIRRCAEGEEGRRLLRESFELAAQLGFRGSPTWLLNNRYPMRARTPDSIFRAYCERNELPECAEEPEAEEHEPEAAAPPEAPPEPAGPAAREPADSPRPERAKAPPRERPAPRERERPARPTKAARPDRAVEVQRPETQPSKAPPAASPAPPSPQDPAANPYE